MSEPKDKRSWLEALERLCRRVARLTSALQSEHSDIEGLRVQPHRILVLTVSPGRAERLALGREVRLIQMELERSSQRDRFELVIRCAAEPLDLLRELRRLRPAVVHYIGRGGQDGLYFQDRDGRARRVSSAALAQVFGAAGASVKLVVLNACDSEEQAEALAKYVDCVVGMSGSIRRDAAIAFAIGFYGGLGERESVEAAYQQGCAAIGLHGLHGADRPRLKVRR